jgi:hypothetical protein
MAHVQDGDAHWVMWVGARQWEGLPGEFDVGQAGWVCPKDDQVEFFRFFPALGSGYGWSYQVACMAKDFLRFTALENA